MTLEVLSRLDWTEAFLFVFFLHQLPAGVHYQGVCLDLLEL